MIEVGSEVEYSESGRGKPRTIRGVVVEIIRGRELLDLRTDKRYPALAFVIRDSAGKLHTTGAMAPPQSSIAPSDDGVDKASGPGQSVSKEREMIEFTGEKHEN